MAQGGEVALLAMFDTLNWCKVPPLTFPEEDECCDREKHLPRAQFHAARSQRERKSSFTRRFRRSVNRIPVWRGMLLSKLGGNSDGVGSGSLVLGKIWAGNDRASMDYIPKPYPGLVTDFRPLKQYSIYQRPDLKWEEAGAGGTAYRSASGVSGGNDGRAVCGVLADALRQKSIDSATPWRS